MRWTCGLITAALVILATAGCTSTGSSSAGRPPPPTGSAGSPSSAAGQPSSSAGEASSAAGSPSASVAPCTSHSCIVDDAKQLVGSVAEDESVITAMDCYESTVKHAAPGIWTVD